MKVLPDLPAQARLSKLPRTMSRATAIAAGACICAAAETASNEYAGDDPVTRERRLASRGTAIWAMDNLWYECLSEKARAAFGYDRSQFYKACGWPE